MVVAYSAIVEDEVIATSVTFMMKLSHHEALFGDQPQCADECPYIVEEGRGLRSMSTT